MSRIDKRGRWWKKLSQKERSAVGQKAVRTRHRNNRLEITLLEVATKMGKKRALVALEGLSC